jgi:hypothetical protein
MLVIVVGGTSDWPATVEADFLLFWCPGGCVGLNRDGLSWNVGTTATAVAGGFRLEGSRRHCIAPCGVYCGCGDVVLQL